jgi:Cu(I)/Ag(I) efflux system membrane fusion protein
MHPSVHARESGKCPICGMDLVPVVKNAENSVSHLEGGPHQFIVPWERQQQIGVTYTQAQRRPMLFEVRSFGTLEPDQARVFEYVASEDGYVLERKVTSPGEAVLSGQALLTIYSPALRANEQTFASLLQAQAGGAAGRGPLDQLVASARRRLQALNVSQNDINEFEQTRQPTDQLVLRSPFDGTVEQVQATVGLSVRAGDKLLTIVDLSKLWLWAEYYEDEIGLLKAGQKVQVTLAGFPSEPLEGTISVISPTVDPIKRTIRVRIDLENPTGRFRSGMYANVTALIDRGEGLAIPVDAVLPTGSRMLAFLDRGGGRLEPRFIQVGRQFVNPKNQAQERYYEVLGGLNEGDRIVSSANFLIDAESQVQGAVKDFGGGATQTSADPKTPDQIGQK